jgi:dolichol kinase
MNKRRKFMHAAWGLLFASLNHFIPTKIFVPAMTLVTTGTLALELLRYRKGFEWMNDVLHKVLGHALRKNEMDGRFTGSLYYFLGVTMTAALYPKSCGKCVCVCVCVRNFFGRNS